MSDHSRVLAYHDGTKHHFHRFARSLGYLDWTSQPNPFRRFQGAPVVPLFPDPAAPATDRLRRTTYDQLLDSSRPSPINVVTVGELLRYALGLSAWKAYGRTRWSLRVNPSSGNLHPTEAYVVAGAVSGLSAGPGVWHYAADAHALERRCQFEIGDRALVDLDQGRMLLVALSSIHWRESWKYGERAFRYCQHDLGHAIAAVSMSAAIQGWDVQMDARWSHADIASVAGLDRDADFVDAEREEAGCLLVIRASSEVLREGEGPRRMPVRPLVDAVRAGQWSGVASQLSEDHVQWTFIDEVAEATRTREGHTGLGPRDVCSGIEEERTDAAESGSQDDRGWDARKLLVQRRSAVAFDGVTTIDRKTFMRMCRGVLPHPGSPWAAMWWAPRIHLAVFVHRVDGVEPGLYLLARTGSAVERLKHACKPEFRWAQVEADLSLWLLQPGDHRLLAKRLSCDQDIAADGFFSLGMIADFDASLAECGTWFYRQLFWESGVIGQVLYLEAEAAGHRATGIGCFYDDGVHEELGLKDHRFQSLYHFTVGAPIDDGRLTSEPGYSWESMLPAK